MKFSDVGDPKVSHFRCPNGGGGSVRELYSEDVKETLYRMKYDNILRMDRVSGEEVMKEDMKDFVQKCESSATSGRDR